MKRIRAWALVIIFLFLKPYPALSNDWQFWQNTYAEKKINPSWRLSVEEEIHIGDDARKLNQYHTDLGLIYSVTPWLDLGANYRFVRAVKDGFWENENRPHFNVTFNKTWKFLNFSNRNRLEDRLLTNTKDFWRYRNLTKIQLLGHLGEREINPYVSYEHFYDFDQPNLFNYNRMSVGVDVEIFKIFHVDVYYLRQDGDGRGTEPKTEVMGLKLNFQF